MRITLITQEVYDNLLDIFNKYPKLTLQNVGYQYIRKADLNEEETTKFKEVNDILKTAIKGFSEFNNFRRNKKTQAIQLRFQYDWTADEERPKVPFTGVGYIELDELLNGFNEE